MQLRCWRTALLRTKKPDPPHYVSRSLFTLPDPPTTCCMSGCANCVWIDYAERIVQQISADSESADTSELHTKESIIKHILKEINDPSLKAFIEMELQFRLKKVKL